MSALHAIGIDLGGTNLKAGLVDADGVIVQRHTSDTEAEQGPDHVLARMAAAAEALIAAAGLRKSDICGIGVGAPGPLSHARGVVINAPNLPGWHNIAVRDRIAAATGLPTVLDNDANAAAFGEFEAGAGKAIRSGDAAGDNKSDVRKSAGDASNSADDGSNSPGSMVMLTLGTGIGGGIIIDGALLRGSRDNAGEIGHIIVEPDGRPCPCGKRGCLERYASARAVALRVAEAIDAGESSVLQAALDRGGEINARDVASAVATGDPLASRIWDETCRYLAIACINIQHMLNPDMVVFGGGMIAAGDALLGPIKSHFERLRWSLADDHPEIAMATLGADAGIIGAAALARKSRP